MHMTSAAWHLQLVFRPVPTAWHGTHQWAESFTHAVASYVWPAMQARPVLCFCQCCSHLQNDSSTKMLGDAILCAGSGCRCLRLSSKQTGSVQMHFHTHLEGFNLLLIHGVLCCQACGVDRCLLLLCQLACQGSRRTAHRSHKGERWQKLTTRWRRHQQQHQHL